MCCRPGCRSFFGWWCKPQLCHGKPLKGCPSGFFGFLLNPYYHTLWPVSLSLLKTPSQPCSTVLYYSHSILRQWVIGDVWHFPKLGFCYLNSPCFKPLQNPTKAFHLSDTPTKKITKMENFTHKSISHSHILLWCSFNQQLVNSFKEVTCKPLIWQGRYVPKNTQKQWVLVRKQDNKMDN